MGKLSRSHFVHDSSFVDVKWINNILFRAVMSALRNKTPQAGEKHLGRVE